MEEDDIEPDYDPYDDRDNDFDSGMSYAQQVVCDRAEYAREKVRKGEWDEEQAAEYRMGA